MKNLRIQGEKLRYRQQHYGKETLNALVQSPERIDIRCHGNNVYTNEKNRKYFSRVRVLGADIVGNGAFSTLNNKMTGNYP